MFWWHDWINILNINFNFGNFCIVFFEISMHKSFEFELQCYAITVTVFRVNFLKSHVKKSWWIIAQPYDFEPHWLICSTFVAHFHIGQFFGQIILIKNELMKKKYRTKQSITPLALKWFTICLLLRHDAILREKCVLPFSHHSIEAQLEANYMLHFMIHMSHVIIVTIGTANCSLSWWYQHYWSSGEEAIYEIFTEAWKPSFYSWQNGEVKFMSHTIALPLARPKQKQRLIFGYLGKISIDLERLEWLAKRV